MRFASLSLLLACTTAVQAADDGRRWLAGDHHIHSRWSVGWDQEQDPPAPIVGGDAIYPTTTNAAMARRFGLEWMVTTDHGGPNHSRVNRDRAYPELLASRAATPEVVQFYGMELDTPGADHSTLIIAHSDRERDELFLLESNFARREPWPADPSRETEARMLEALATMDGFPEKPIVIANHPSRSAVAMGEFGRTDPAELRAWNDTAPEVAVGMAGAPGHQARRSPRGGYRRVPTLGGFDQMTAVLGGVWDSMLGEGRRWWITANSDSHVHYTEGGSDFWPGEYSKTYVHARKHHDSILDSLRRGHVFVTTGDLVSGLEIEVRGEHGAAVEMLGETLFVDGPQTVTVRARIEDPAEPNFHGDLPELARVDLIVGPVGPQAGSEDVNANAGTHVEARFDATTPGWTRRGEIVEIEHAFTVDGPVYLRLRGTNTAQLEPEPDPLMEDPWSDLWFYSNPVFVELARP
ncbi:MAG: hypothetical protein V2J24_19450 [Pseudomonadales bacterium]|nr:hypothetical protein [Pseudomonadales bacterium]